MIYLKTFHLSFRGTDETLKTLDGCYHRPQFSHMAFVT